MPVVAITSALVLFAYAMCRLTVDNPVLKLFATLLFPTGLIVLIAACVILFCLPVIHFYRNLMTGEGYLSFTLPVTTYHLVASKLIVATVTMLCNLALTVGGLLLLISTKMDLRSISLQGILMPDGQSPVRFIVVMCVLIFITCICQQLFLFLSVCLGQMLSKNKIVGSVLGYVIIYAANQVINLVLIGIIFITIGFDNIEVFMSSTDNLMIFFSALAHEYIVLCTVAYILSCRILKNRLNLS